MKIIEECIGCKLIESNEIIDERGWFNVVITKEDMQALGFKGIVQINHSYTKYKGIVRGPNYQKKPYNQAKLVRCLKGSFYSVGIDIDPLSPNYMKWCGFELKAGDHRIMYVPDSFAHGFVSLEDDTELEYMVDNAYNKESAVSFMWNDPDVNIDWTDHHKVELKDILSDKNRYAPRLKEAMK